MSLRALSIRNILLLTVSALTLVIALLALKEVALQWQRLHDVHELKEAMQISDSLFAATDKFSIERDIASTLLRASDPDTIIALKLQLDQSRRQTDDTITMALYALRQYNFPELADLRNNLERGIRNLQDTRQRIDAAIKEPLLAREQGLDKQWADEGIALIQHTQDLWTSFVRHFTGIDPVVTQHLRFKHFLRIITTYNSRERALIGRLLAENIDATAEETSELLRGQGAVALSWRFNFILAEQSGLYPLIAPQYRDAQSHYQTVNDMVKGMFYIPGTRRGQVYPIGADLWIEISTQAAESLDTLKEVTLLKTRDYIEQLERRAQRIILLHIAVLIASLILCAYSFRIIMHWVIHPINEMIRALLDAREGKTPVIKTDMNRDDEIGQLAQVLSAFQENMEEIRRTSIMLQNYAYALERSNRELDDFAYIASHDLKEPLRGIHNHSRFLLEDNEGKLDEESVQKLNRLVFLTQRMERLVNDLLYFSRLGRQELAIQETDIRAVVKDIENTLEIFLSDNGVKITINTPIPVVTCDKTRITELLRNLITNAVKYNDKPHKRIEIGYLPRHPTPTGHMAAKVFFVRDNGKGIPPEFHEEIFRIFKRLQAGAEGVQEGTGVGLTFVKKIIERHGGRIWLESTVGQGTTFYFTLEGEGDDTAAEE